jgi:hypothetical protein
VRRAKRFDSDDGASTCRFSRNKRAEPASLCCCPTRLLLQTELTEILLLHPRGRQMKEARRPRSRLGARAARRLVFQHDCSTCEKKRNDCARRYMMCWTKPSAGGAGPSPSQDAPRARPFALLPLASTTSTTARAAAKTVSGRGRGRAHGLETCAHKITNPSKSKRRRGEDDAHEDVAGARNNFSRQKLRPWHEAVRAYRLFRVRQCAVACAAAKAKRAKHSLMREKL